MGNFVKVSKKFDLPPGACKHIELEGKGIAIALYNVDGKFYAIDGTCSHMGGPLGEGDLDGNVVTCPWHGWQFDVVTGNCVIRPGTKQTTYSVKTEGDDILVELS